MKNFGTRLRDSRKSNKLTQFELAKKLKVKQSTISNYEKNLRVPSASALINISKKLNVSVDYLLGRSTIQSLKPETSYEVSGSVITNSSIESLQADFLRHLIDGKYQDASELIFSFRTSDTNLMFFNVNVFEPVLKSVGKLWQEGKISVADEHLISDMITGLMTRLEHADNLKKIDKEDLTAAFMLTGAEEHELPLRMIETVFKTNGWTTYYLGKNIPISSLKKFLIKHKIQIIGLSVTMSSHLNTCAMIISTIKSFAPKIRPKIIVGGKAVNNEDIAMNQLGADFYFESQQELLEKLVDLEKKILE